MSSTLDTLVYFKSIFSTGWTSIPRGMSYPCNGKERLEIVSYNVWFDEQYFDERAKLVFDLIKGCDIICLQEVTRKFMKLLRTESWVRYNYCICDSQFGNYGVVI